MEPNFISGTDRQQQILQLLERQQRLSVAEICTTFDVSEATARRDLESLTSQGKLQRVHGGAIVLTQAPPNNPSSSARMNKPKKKSALDRLLPRSCSPVRRFFSARVPLYWRLPALCVGAGI